MSMVGRKMRGQIDKRLRQAFAHSADMLFGGCSCILFGDFGQLPPVMDLPLYTTHQQSIIQGRQKGYLSGVATMHSQHYNN